MTILVYTIMTSFDLNYMADSFFGVLFIMTTMRRMDFNYKKLDKSNIRGGFIYLYDSNNRTNNYGTMSFSEKIW